MQGTATNELSNPPPGELEAQDGCVVMWFAGERAAQGCTETGYRADAKSKRHASTQQCKFTGRFKKKPPETHPGTTPPPRDMK